MRKVYLLVLGLAVGCIASAQIVQWTFETCDVSLTAGTTPVITVGSAQADVGTLTAGSSFSGFHSNASTVWSRPVGNGSGNAISSTHWGVGDYYQFQFSTTGYQDISLTWDHTGSGTGPRDFKVQYSTDGSTFIDATGVNSTYMVTNETWSSMGAGNPLSKRTLDLSLVSAIQNAAIVYIRLVNSTTTSVNGGTVAIGGTSRVDNFTVNGNVFTTNTITLTSLSSSTFNLTDCSDTETGTVDFTSTGTFVSVNIYSVELSDASGVFAPGTLIGTFTSTDNSGTINITIPAGTLSGTQYKMRIKSNNPAVTSNLSVDVTINQAGACNSSATDHFRSKVSGDWNAVSTWESSATGALGTWINATLTPTSAANTITIRGTHTVAITSSVTIDQVTIETDAILNHTGGTITLEDGAGNDIEILSGGVFRLALANTPPVYGAGSPVINVNNDGVVRVAAGGMTGAGAGVNANNFVYNHQSILEWAPTGASSFTTTNVTFFPNAGTAVIPIFKCNNPIAMTVGAGGFTTFNGVFEAVGATVTWSNAGIKTFRNGIRGTADITSTGTSGMFVINGQLAELGGTGLLTLPGAGLQIGSASGTTVNLSSDKTVNGNITLLPSNTFVELGNNTLTLSGTINGAEFAYVRTNGTGVLKITNIAHGGGLALFPIGHTSYNPLLIINNNGSTTTDFSARVTNDILPDIAFPSFGINRTWNIGAADAVSDVSVMFQYALADAGPDVNPPQDMELLMYSGMAWSILPGQGGIPTFGANPTFVNTTLGTGITINDELTPFALGLSGGYILPIDCIIACRSSKQNNNGIISWDVSTCSEIFSFEVQRAVNGGDFVTIGTVIPGSSLAYHFTDMQLAPGTNLYRIKIKANNGVVKYSNTVAIINDTKGILITAISPNPVSDRASVLINAAKAGNIRLLITDIGGRTVRQWTAAVGEGSNTIPVEAAALPNGIYHLSAITADSRTVIRFVKQ